ncbi:hypothetical protein ACMSWW_001134 [Cronobacter turicensis]
MSKENIDYRAIVERIAELPHGGVTDIGLLTVTVQSYKDRLVKVEAERDALAAENTALKASRAVLAENTFEACNAIASAGFSHEAIMRGLYESTGNGNKYPKPITTLVDEAMRKLETPATDAFLREVRAQGVEEFVNRLRDSADIYDKNGRHEWADHNRVVADDGNVFAAQLRQGGAA